MIISVVVGYMLKVLRSGRDISAHKREFDAIKHGDYVKFINLVGGEIPHLVVYKGGVVKSGIFPPSQDDISFELLVKSGNSLLKFYKLCVPVYGNIIDNEISDSVYETAAVFEISLRMHANNRRLISTTDTIQKVIDQLADSIGLSSVELAALHRGRDFLNVIKHGRKKFATIQEGIAALEGAYEVVKKRKLTI